jgi:hypothetical protein
MRARSWPFDHWSQRAALFDWTRSLSFPPESVPLTREGADSYEPWFVRHEPRVRRGARRSERITLRRVERRK